MYLYAKLASFPHSKESRSGILLYYISFILFSYFFGFFLFLFVFSYHLLLCSTCSSSLPSTPKTFLFTPKKLFILVIFQVLHLLQLWFSWICSICFLESKPYICVQHMLSLWFFELFYLEILGLIHDRKFLCLCLRIGTSFQAPTQGSMALSQEAPTSEHPDA